jgi:predicted SAM-dependent methyltransferase
VKLPDDDKKHGIHDHCFVCQSRLLKELPRFNATGLVKCTNCGLVFSKWIPTEQFLMDFYNQYPEYQHWNSITSMRYRTLMDSFEKYRKTNNLLEVGSGEGFFLDEAKAKNWNVHGTEFIDRFIERCRERGISMERGMLDVSKYEPNSMDIIIWIEVIEHINNPIEELEKFNKLLRPGGIVYLTTPNFNSLSRLALKDKLNLIQYPNHLTYYTPSSLRYLFEHNGFRKINLVTTGVSPGRIFSIIKNSSKNGKMVMNADTQQIDEPLRERIESSALLKIARDTTNNILTLTGTGDSLKGTFQKIS